MFTLFIFTLFAGTDAQYDCEFCFYKTKQKRLFIVHLSGETHIEKAKKKYATKMITLRDGRECQLYNNGFFDFYFDEFTEKFQISVPDRGYCSTCKKDFKTIKALNIHVVKDHQPENSGSKPNVDAHAQACMPPQFFEAWAIECLSGKKFLESLR